MNLINWLRCKLGRHHWHDTTCRQYERLGWVDTLESRLCAHCGRTQERKNPSLERVRKVTS